MSRSLPLGNKAVGVRPRDGPTRSSILRPTTCRTSALRTKESCGRERPQRSLALRSATYPIPTTPPSARFLPPFSVITLSTPPCSLDRYTPVGFRASTGAPSIDRQLHPANVPSNAERAVCHPRLRTAASPTKTMSSNL